MLGLPEEDDGDHGCWGGELPTGERGGEELVSPVANQTLSFFLFYQKCHFPILPSFKGAKSPFCPLNKIGFYSNITRGDGAPLGPAPFGAGIGGNIWGWGRGRG